jgi:hypothetical protein
LRKIILKVKGLMGFLPYLNRSCKMIKNSRLSAFSDTELYALGKLLDFYRYGGDIDDDDCVFAYEEDQEGDSHIALCDLSAEISSEKWSREIPWSGKNYR